MPWRITEDGARTIEATYKIVTMAVLVIGGFWTLYTYSTNRAAQNKSAAMEAKKPYLEKRLEFYIDATSTMSTIVTSKDAKEISAAKEHYLRLLWGPARVVSTPEVQNQMENIGECLKAGPDCHTSLEDLTWELDRLCGASMRAEWGDYPPGAPTILKGTVQ